MVGGPEWLPALGWEEFYEVSSWGQVRRISTRRMQRGWIQPKRGRYRWVCLNAAGRREKMPLHRLVASTFHGPPRAGFEVRHLDGDSLNNCADNLAWGTPSENRVDTVKHGRHPQVAKSACPAGHLYDAANTYHRPSRPASRECKECRCAHKRRVRALRKAAACNLGNDHG